MDPDNYQQAWQAHSSQMRVKIYEDLLLKELQRSQLHFRAMIFWRDVREVGTGLLMLPVWFYLGITLSLPWTWYLTVPAIVFVTVFIIVDRRRHQQRPPEPGEPLLQSVQESLAHVEHQIWLLRNIFWWYIFPFVIPMFAFFAHVASQRPGGWAAMLVPMLSVALIDAGVYFLNQFAVHSQLEPRRQELLKLLASLKDETIGEHDKSVGLELNGSRGGIKSTLTRLTPPVMFAIGALVVAGCALLLFVVFNGGTDPIHRERVARTAVSIDNTDQFRDRIDEFLHLARLKTGFSGVVVVARKGEPVYQGSFGFSHLASKTPNSLDTPFRVASLSKQFTAAAILSLESEGKLSIDDPVHRYLPEFAAEPYRGITIYQLMTHTSGLPRIPEDASRRARWQAMSKSATPVNDYVRLACEMPLKFVPGQGYEYSNFGYRVLSELIVRVTGREYADFMEERLFKPLDLKQSGVARISPSQDEAKVAEELRFVRLDRDTHEPTYLNSNGGRNYGAGYGSGGIYTSVNDLMRWDRILADDSFLSAEQKAKLFQPAKENSACGWTVKKSDLDGRVYQTVSGANEGYFSKMTRIPEDDLVIIALGNLHETTEIDEILEQLFKLCRSLPYQDLYKVKGRFSDNVPILHYSNFADAAKDGSEAFKRADYDTAIAAWDEAIRLEPNHSEIHRWRGDASLNKRQNDKALSEYDEAIRLDPENGMAYCCRGAAWTEKWESTKAIAAFDEAIRLDPTIANIPFYQRYRKAAESLGGAKPISPKK